MSVFYLNLTIPIRDKHKKLHNMWISDKKKHTLLYGTYTTFDVITVNSTLSFIDGSQLSSIAHNLI